MITSYETTISAAISAANKSLGRHMLKKNKGKRIKGSPTGAQFSAYEAMFEYFNRVLFGGELPAVVLNFSRRRMTYGFFAPDRWAGGGKSTHHEISLNPEALRRDVREIAGTLVHEMCHLWQQENGKPSRTGYHNGEWAKKMRTVGLMPSSTGEPGGKETGQRVSHYEIKGGPFAVAFAKMPDAIKLPLTCAPEPKNVKKYDKNKVVYECPSCENKVWGKAGLSIECNDCGEDFEAQS